MDILQRNELLMIAGGNPMFVAVGVGISTYAGTATIINATQTLNQFGHALGEQVFNLTHPDPLGQMVYPAVVLVENSEQK